MSTPLDVPLDCAGLTLIEASAGSGKTRAITTLVARLVVERGLELDGLLIVTYTRAATAELKERIRRTLRSTWRALESPCEEDDQARELVRHWNNTGTDVAMAARRLDLAIHDIDRANIHTIHGICARLLAEFSFECGLPFHCEITGSLDTCVTRATHDVWQERASTFTPGLARHMNDKKVSPESLAQWAAGVPLQPGLEVHGVPKTAPSAKESEAAWSAALADVRALWEVHGDSLKSALWQQHILSKASYPEEKSLERLRVIEDTLRDVDDDRLWEAGGAGRFGRPRLESALLKNQTLPDNPLIDAFERLEVAGERVRSAYADVVRHIRNDILEGVKSLRSKLVRENRRLGYQDLLNELHGALEGRNGMALARGLRERYPVALIDEYQDTDPLQTRIFTRVYDPALKVPGTPPALFIVGDPKQSIYWFRGADVFSYLEAQKRARNTLSLRKNWRSAPSLVRGVNHLFDTRAPFLIDSIAFSPAVPGRDEAPALKVKGDRGPPLRVWNLGDATRASATRESVERTGREVQNLLRASQRGDARIGGSPLKGSDIAVLVRRRIQGRDIAMDLRQRGVGCVEIDDTSVFDTREAEQLERVLWALAEPGRTTRERTMLSGDIFGLDNEALLALKDDDATWNRWLEHIGGWRHIWRVRGIGTALHHILASGDSLTAYGNAPRRLSNVRHLIDILQDAEADLRLGPVGLATWFSRQLSDTAHRDEASLLRLESDEDLVRIMTVHSSKGLEFPIVFCPFTWDVPSGRTSRDDTATCHLERDDGTGTYPVVLNLDPGPGDRNAEFLENFMEDVRLLYVAVTRARERCVIATARLTRTRELSALSWLIHQEPLSAGYVAPKTTNTTEKWAVPLAVGGLYAAVKTSFNKLSGDAWRQQIERVFQDSRGTVGPGPESRDTRSPRAASGAHVASTLEARRFTRKLESIRHITSFSALSADHGPGGRLIGRPDHDDDREEPTEDSGEAPRETLSPFTFPRGATAGRCFHGILEAMDLRPEDDLDATCRRQLRHYGIDLSWAGVARTVVVNARATHLEEPGYEGFCLADPLERLPELEFSFPADRLRRRCISECLLRHGYPDPIPSSASAEPIRGYLRGFIDLVIARNDRWYVLDYKSNWLGNRAGDYASARLDPAMHNSGYTFQYLLYLVALDRYLATRITDYDYERHIGGAFYLFLRGMDPEAGMSRGVWFDRPTHACIRDLDACFREEAS
ncbi:MAG: exodeoxyribonuclease V subunit beta [bacterium]|nr:exodeoxyribonuclease V subunit beta [bacterium]